jgi:hypothetical protein
MMTKPEFKPDVPEPLLHGATQRDRWMYEQQSIQRQQNDWIIDRMAVGERRFEEERQARVEIMSKQDEMDKRLKVIELLKDRLSAKWAVLAFVAASIVGPIAMAIFGAWLAPK